jgi:hypothetical protein
MHIDRIDGDLVLLDGYPPSAARWHLCNDRIELVFPSGRAHTVAPRDVPMDVLVSLLALRDVDRYQSNCCTTEPASLFALRTWLGTSRDALLTSRMEAGARAPSWTVYRFTFLMAFALGSTSLVSSFSAPAANPASTP